MKKKKYINIIIVILILIGIGILTMKYIYKYNSGKYYIDYPTEILTYNYDGKQYFSDFDEIEIEKKEESIFYTKTQYKFYLSDEYRKRIVYVYIVRKYNLKKLDWETEHWEYYKDEEIENY